MPTRNGYFFQYFYIIGHCPWFMKGQTNKWFPSVHKCLQDWVWEHVVKQYCWRCWQCVTPAKKKKTSFSVEKDIRACFHLTAITSKIHVIYLVQVTDHRGHERWQGIAWAEKCHTSPRFGPLWPNGRSYCVSSTSSNKWTRLQERLTVALFDGKVDSSVEKPGFLKKIQTNQPKNKGFGQCDLNTVQNPFWEY